MKVVQTWQNEFETSYRQLLLFELIPDGRSNNGCLPKVMSTNKVSNKAVKSFCFFLTNNAVQVGVLHFLTLYDCLESSRVDQLCTVKSPTEKKPKNKTKKI